MLRLVASAAILGLAMGAVTDQEALAVRATQTDTRSFAARLAARIAATKANHGLLKDGVDTAVNSLGRVAALGDAMANAEGIVQNLASTVPTDFSAANDARHDKLTDLSDDLNDELDAQLVALTNLMNSQNSEANDLIDDGLDALGELTDGVGEALDGLRDDLDESKNCADDGEIYDKDDDECIKPDLSPDSYMDKVTHKMITGSDGREYGWINNRDITFTKHYDDTYVRVMYYDNMRVHGHTTHGMWELEFCDGSGSGCCACNNPGRMMHWRWSGHQHGWWMNDHTGGTIMGLCKSTCNRQLTKGDYQLKVFLRQNYYDMFTGHNQVGSFMVDEVMKY